MSEPEHGDRNQALDFTKGALVLFMILYHWINYFVGIGGPVFTYLRFVPPAFIFIAGFVIANVYPAKYGFGDSRVYKRLVIRGLKLLALFTFLNVIANIFFARSNRWVMPGIDGFFRDAAAIYISGNAKAAFGVLVPIGYLLFLSAGVFLAARVYKNSVHRIGMAVLLCVVFLNLYGFPSQNLWFIAIGLFGMVFGFYPIKEVNKWVDHPYAVVCANIGYIFAISMWGTSDLLQVLGVCLSVSLIYLIGAKSADWGGIRGPIILLGKYSLFGYVAQIGILQLLHRGLPYLKLNDWILWPLSFLGAFVLTIILVRLVQDVRPKSRSVDWLYRAVFT
jgi:peptidoglycan/LPS O-acetylase OafA/YrhL